MSIAENITFGLAITGYALLGADAVTRTHGRRLRWLHWLTAAVVFVHVLGVWQYRYAWDVGFAWQKSVPGFLIFHAAFLIIVLSPLLRGTKGDRASQLGFATVTMGSSGAVFRYPEVAVLGVPVFAVAVICTGLMVVPRRLWAGGRAS